MEHEFPDPRLVASARQIADGPMAIAVDDILADDDGAGHEATPLYMTWFALGHVAVLLYLAMHAMKL